MTDDYATLRAAFHAGARIQAWHLICTTSNSNQGRWETLTPPEGREPEFGCAPHLYRIHPDDTAILATASEQAPVAYIDPGTLENLVTLGETHVYSPEFRRVRDVPLFSSPAHTSEARDADFWALERGCAALLGGATWAAMHPEDKREYRDRLNAAMRQEAGSRE